MFKYSFQPATMIGVLLNENGEPSRITIIVNDKTMEVNPVWLKDWKMIYYNSFVDMVKKEFTK